MPIGASGAKLDIHVVDQVNGAALPAGVRLLSWNKHDISLK